MAILASPKPATWWPLGIPGPRGAAWSPSTIHGHASRGTGILNNELYCGRLVWTQRYVKDPDTGKRQARLNAPDAWIVTEVPHLRIVDEGVWDAAKARQAATRRRGGARSTYRDRAPPYPVGTSMLSEGSSDTPRPAA